MSSNRQKPICGAWARTTGKACQNTKVFASGRCKLHGGKSTGPKSVEGKKRSAQNGFKKGWKNSVMSRAE
jgi:hypothetical protein